MSNTRSGGGGSASVGDKRAVTIDEDAGYKSDGTSKQSALKKAKTSTQVDYDEDGYNRLGSRLKKNGVATNFSKVLDDTSRSLVQKAGDAYKILVNNEKDLENKKADGITDDVKRFYLAQLKKKAQLAGDVQTFLKADANDDQGLSLNEFCNLLNVTADDEDAMGLFNLFDANHDGSIDMEEFLEMMRDPNAKRQQLYAKLNDMIAEFVPPITIDTLNAIVSMYNAQQQSANSTNIHAFLSVKSAIKEVNLPSDLRQFLDSLRKKTAEELEMFEKFFYIGSAFTKFLKEGNADELSFQDKQLFEYFTIKQRAMNNVPLTLLSLSQDF